MEIAFNDFLKAVEPQHRQFAEGVHKELTAGGYKMKIESKASGLFITYKHPKTKRSLLNFLFRKSGLLVRLYPVSKTPAVPALTAEMVKEVGKTRTCDNCSEKCQKGYKFTIGGQAYDKCHYGAFLFAVTEESKPILTKWIHDEIAAS